MSKFNPFLFIGAVVLMGTSLCCAIGIAQVSQPAVRLIAPPLQQLIPFEAGATTPQKPAQLSLQATDRAGQPLNANLHLQLFTPSPTPWLTTDFPIVEGTKMLDLETAAPDGALQLQQMLPIRGTYRLVVGVTPVAPAQFAPFQQTLTLPVSENPAKYRNAGILVLVVLLAGIGGGWLIGGQQTIRPGEIAPPQVRLLLSGAAIAAILALLAVNLSSAFVQHHEHPAEIVAQPLQKSSGLTVQLAGDGAAMVGQPATLIAQIKAERNQPVTDVLLNIKVTSLEDGWTAFALQTRPDANGQFTWQQEFFDGVPHQVQVEVAPQPQSARQFQPFQVTKAIEVTSIAPPLARRLISLVYLTLILLVGLAIGLRWRSSTANGFVFRRRTS
ncbi:hypothetical protein IFO70_13860 [Phormidium tenue FACHB-886]|nr:hypothetical protein [Phormidium tenue FACHB-886]